ncbi:MAG: transketolase [Actinomycetota bacterium]|nr:transketolase [Actinomycetota bacterium]
MSTIEQDAKTDIERLSIDTIRTLSMDGVQEANSGHPGMPMAMAPAAYLLFTRFMRHNPRDPLWPDRDRFLLSAGHGSMLLYAVLHLSGYELSLDELKNFRQWDSLTPGHPERDRENVTPGVEMTTGPLGQGFANGVGMAIAERFLRAKFGAEVQDHRIFSICSDGDVQEGIGAEAASLAGYQKLGRLVYLYDDNLIQLDGPTKETFSEDVAKRFEAYGWHTRAVDDVNDVDDLADAIQEGIDETERPSLIRVRTIIGWPAPEAQGTSKAHGEALGEDQVKATKEILGWDPEAKFLVPEGVQEHFSQVERGEQLQNEWRERFDSWRDSHAELAKEWDAAWSDPPRPLPGLAEAVPRFDPEEDEAIATRGAGATAMEAFAGFTPTMLGGAADLAGSTKTEFPDSELNAPGTPEGRNIKFGVREHGMGGAVNGMAGHGGIVRPYGSTFLQFADYMRGAIRLSALMALDVAWVFTHDSIGLGEDGPTHQPVEHLAALRAIPGLTVLRPGDAAETAECWRSILEDVNGPAALILSRQKLTVLARQEGGGEFASATEARKGAYVLIDAEGEGPEVVLVGTGSELGLCLQARDALQEDGTPTRVVSMPSWELFAHQDDDYRNAVLPPDVPKISVEAGVAMGWRKWVDASVSLERFGASAPGPEVYERLGFTPDAVVQRARDVLGGDATPGATPRDAETGDTPQG